MKVRQIWSVLDRARAVRRYALLEALSHIARHAAGGRFTKPRVFGTGAS